MATHTSADRTLELQAATSPEAARDHHRGIADERITRYEFPFSEEESELFRSDDADAGRAIGKILTTLFTYTAVIMSIVIWWPLRPVST